MREFDRKKTAQFFNETYAALDHAVGQNPETRLHFRDQILLKHILIQFEPPETTILDYGCGQGRLVAELLGSGFDAFGMEKHAGMRKFAETETSPWNGERSRILSGGKNELANIPSGSFDVVVVMGVFQYLPPDEYQETLREIRRILRSRGHMVATYQNALFDLYTFNKYTVDFFVNELWGPHLDSHQKSEAAGGIESLLLNADKPSYAPTRARDNIYVRLTNPLTIADELEIQGFELREKYFYEYFGLPPLLCDSHKKFAKQIAGRFEVDNATAWEGYFMANAFLAHAICRDR